MSVKYAIEVAVEAKTEVAAMRYLETLGIPRAMDTKLSDLDRQADLFIIKVSMTEEELGDEIYHRLNKDNKVFILSDELSAKRAQDVTNITSIVERQLKKLLICVLPEIEEVFSEIIELHQKHKSTKKSTSRIDHSRDISNFSFGELPFVLQQDISALSKNKLLSSEGLAALIVDSADYEGFRARVSDISKPKTVWASINSILELPTDYANISKALNGLCDARNKASHLETITSKDLDRVRKDQKHIMRYIGGIKSDYQEQLRANMEAIAKTMRAAMDTIARIDTTAFQNIQKQITEMYKPFIDTIAKIKVDPVSPDIIKTMQGNVKVQQDAIDSIARTTKNLSKFDEYNQVMHDLTAKGIQKYSEDMIVDSVDIQSELLDIASSTGTESAKISKSLSQGKGIKKSKNNNSHRKSTKGSMGKETHDRGL